VSRDIGEDRINSRSARRGRVELREFAGAAVDLAEAGPSPGEETTSGTDGCAPALGDLHPQRRRGRPLVAPT